MRGCWLLLGLAACFSPTAASGVPCDPSSPVCPGSETCQQVAGQFVCTEGTVVAPDGNPGIDTPIVDPDAPADSAPVNHWTILQSHGAVGTSLTIDPTTAGSTIIVAVETGAADVTDIDDNANSSYTDVPLSRGENTTDANGIELWYARNVSAGATTITVTASLSHSLVAWEVTGIRSNGDPIDAVATLDDQPMSTLPFGAEITTTASGDFVISVVIVHNQITDLTAGSKFTNDSKTFGNGWAHLTDDHAPAGTYRARWNQPINGASCASTVAFLIDP